MTVEIKRSDQRQMGNEDPDPETQGEGWQMKRLTSLQNLYDAWLHQTKTEALTDVPQDTRVEPEQETQKPQGKQVFPFHFFHPCLADRSLFLRVEHTALRGAHGGSRYKKNTMGQKKTGTGQKKRTAVGTK